ncbi:tetratricopeptide repeat protein [Phormidium tenue FACHB-886]|nr:tetratricopeptide repeat protein [Phormidium tenue FACHB-886]
MQLRCPHPNLGQSAQARDYYQQSLVIAREIGDRRDEGGTLNDVGVIQLWLGQAEAAATTLLDAIDVLESIRTAELTDADKVSLFDTQAHTYRFLQQALIAQNQPEAALAISERGRARTFAERLSTRLSAPSTNPSTLATPSVAQIKQIAQQQNVTLVQYRSPINDHNSAISDHQKSVICPLKAETLAGTRS